MAENPVPRARVASLDPTAYEKALAAGAVVLFALVVVALVRGYSQLGAVSPIIWTHLVTVMLPLALTPVMMTRTRGDRLHRTLGWVWAVSLFGTALVSFGIRLINDGGFSVIHILSMVTVVTVPLLVLAARRHRVARHRRSARIIVTAALLVAGYFTLIPGRMLGHWLWG